MKQMKHMNYSTNNNNNEQEILNKIRTMQKNISIIVLASTINSISIMFIANEISKNNTNYYVPTTNIHVRWFSYDL